MRRRLTLLLAVLHPGLPARSPGSLRGRRAGGSGRGRAGRGPCGSGSWQPGWLEIHHINAGLALSTLIVSPSGRSLLLDAGESAWDQPTAPCAEEPSRAFH